MSATLLDLNCAELAASASVNTRGPLQLRDGV